MNDQFTPLKVGERVAAPTGARGVIYSLPRRAAADIRRAVSERERDMSPYTIQLDRGEFVTYRGHELDRVS